MAPLAAEVAGEEGEAEEEVLVLALC